MEQITVQELVKFYNLEPHHEGGFFKETYRAKGNIAKNTLPERYSGDRNYSTAIYFLVPEGNKSHLHRVKSDEVWHFYLGGSMTVVTISPEGKVEKTIMGQNLQKGEKVQHVIPANYWFGSYPNPGTIFSFLGVTVAPGFDFADFEMGKRAELLKQFPGAKKEIEFLTD